jgi:hypothetical protein
VALVGYRRLQRGEPPAAVRLDAEHTATLLSALEANRRNAWPATQPDHEERLAAWLAIDLAPPEGGGYRQRSWALLAGMVLKLPDRTGSWKRTLPLDCPSRHTFRQWLELRLLARQPDSRPWVLRDRFMAENALAQLARFGSDSKAVIWAHNGHVGMFGRSESDHPSDGALLRQALGTDYRAVGFAFGSGRFNAASPGDGGTADWTLRVHAAHPAPDIVLEALLDQVELDCFALEPARVALCRHALRLRKISVVSAAEWEQFKIQAVPADCYDLIVYFRELHPSRPL